MNSAKHIFDRPVPVPRIAEVLERHYDLMCGWALGLTRGDSQQAEDILHDLCLHLVATQPDLGRIENLDGYLYTSLRHVYLSYLSRSSREALEQITSLEFDSIYLTLFSKNRSDALSQQNELRRICGYALSRKASVKSASFFILQFFYGYTAKETASVARVPTAAVHNKVRKLREELQSHLAESPGARVDEHSPPVRLRWTSVPSAELFQELRRNILAARDGECPNRAELLEGYEIAEFKPLDRFKLSHIVSCESCLQRIQEHLGAGGGGGKWFGARKITASRETPGEERSALLGDRTAFLDLVAEHGKYLLRHRPARLSIAIDGKVVASQDIRARLSAQTVRLERLESSSFVEVFSELGLRLALLPIGMPPPQGSGEQCQRVSMSDGRWLELTLAFDGLGLSGQVVYCDPALPSKRREHSAKYTGTSDAIDRRAAFPAGLAESTGEVLSRERSGDALAMPLGTTAAPVPRGLAESSGQRFMKRLRKAASCLRQFPLSRMNPFLASAILCSAAAVVCLILWLQSKPKIDAETLLQRAEVQSGAPRAGQPGVIYQKVSIRHAGRNLERAIYRDAQGKRIPRRQALSSAEEKLKSSLEEAGVDWNDPLSATTYRHWQNDSPARRDTVAESGKALLTLTTILDAPGPVRQETLTVRESDFHPVARTVSWRDESTVEIAELNYDVMPWSSGSEIWFEPLGGDRESYRRQSRSTALPALGAQPSPAQIAETELDVRIALHDLGADQNDWISLVSGAGGVTVKGLVETETRKHEVESRLRLIRYAKSDLVTFAEAERRNGSGDRTTAVFQASASGAPSPLDAWLSGRGMDRERAGQIEIELSDCYVKFSRETRALTQLLERFDGRQLTPEALRKLAALAEEHRREALAALDGEEKILAGAGLREPDGDESFSPNRVTSATERNNLLCGELLSGNREHPRPAATIASELQPLIEALRASLTRLPLPGAAVQTAADGPSIHLNR